MRRFCQTPHCLTSFGEKFSSALILRVWDDGREGAKCGGLETEMFECLMMKCLNLMRVCARGELGDGSSGRRHVVSKLNVWMFRCLMSKCFNLMCVWDGSLGIICLHVHMFELLKINCLNLMMKCLNWEMGAGGEDMWSGSWNVWMFRCLSVWWWRVWIVRWKLGEKTCGLEVDESSSTQSPNPAPATQWGQ